MNKRIIPKENIAFIEIKEKEECTDYVYKEKMEIKFWGIGSNIQKEGWYHKYTNTYQGTTEELLNNEKILFFDEKEKKLTFKYRIIIHLKVNLGERKTIIYYSNNKEDIEQFLEEENLLTNDFIYR